MILRSTLGAPHAVPATTLALLQQQHHSCSPVRAQAEHSSCQVEQQLRRRQLVEATLLLAATCLRQPSPADAQTVSQELPSSTEEFGLYELTGNVFSTLEFSMTLPEGFQYIQPGAFSPGAPPPTSARGRQPPPNPLKAKFVSGKQVITIIVRGASDIRPTFFQVADVSQFGDVSSAKSLFVPRGARLIESHSERTEPGSRDTGTIAGIVPLPPQNFYRYNFEAGPTKFAISVGAVKGRLFVAGASAPMSEWAQVGPQLQDAVNSFRLALPQT